MKKKGRGLFITFEGPEGAGKTTQIRLLKDFLIENDLEVVETREPGGTELAEKLRNIVKYHNGDEKIANQTEVLLIEASRAQHVNHLIKPAIKQGKIVLCDRFIDSTIAYQGYARGEDIAYLAKLNNYAISGCVPDITFLLDIAPEFGFNRVSERNEENQGKDRFEQAGEEFHKKVRNGFLEIASCAKERIKIINANDSIANIHKKIITIYNDYEKY